MSWLLGELPFWRSPLHSLGSLSPHPLTEIDATQISAVCWGDVFKRWEETLDKFRPISETDQEKTVGLLRVFHKHLPEDGKLVLMKDVITIGPDDDKLRELAQHLRNAVLKPMRLTSGKQPKTPPVKPLRLDSIWYAYEQQYAVKQECLRRDGYQCAYTNWPDLESVQDGLVSVGPDNDGRLVACSKCARILPFALGELGDNDQEDTATGRHNKRVIWSTLQRYFPSFVKDKAETLKMVNRVENGLTLDRPLSHYFETFDVVFRPTEQADVYHLEWMSPLRCHAERRFTSNDETMRLTSSDSNLPLPRPEFLEMHYRLGHILKDSRYLHHFAFNKEMEKTFEDPANVMSDGSTDLGRIIAEKLLMHL